MTNLLKAKMKKCTVWNSETARQFLPTPGTTRLKATPKEEEKALQTKSAFAVGALVTSVLIAEQRLALTEDPVVLLERNLYGHPLAGLLWKRQFEEILLKYGWEKVSNWECLLVHR